MMNEYDFVELDLDEKENPETKKAIVSKAQLILDEMINCCNPSIALKTVVIKGKDTQVFECITKMEPSQDLKTLLNIPRYTSFSEIMKNNPNLRKLVDTIETQYSEEASKIRTEYAKRPHNIQVNTLFNEEDKALNDIPSVLLKKLQESPSFMRLLYDCVRSLFGLEKTHTGSKVKNLVTKLENDPKKNSQGWTK